MDKDGHSTLLTSGALFFNGGGSLACFSPSSISNRLSRSRILVAKLRMSNHPMKVKSGVGKRAMLTRNVSCADSVALGGRGHSFILSFGGLSCTRRRRGCGCHLLPCRAR